VARGALARVFGSREKPERNRARLAALSPFTRRRFLQRCATTTAGAWLVPALARGASAPNLQFPTQPRQRIAIASYPFREFIAGEESKAAKPMDLKDFAAHVIEKFQVNKIEPWTGHFPSNDPKYLAEFRAAVEKAGAAVVNIAVDAARAPNIRSVIRLVISLSSLFLQRRWFSN